MTGSAPPDSNDAQRLAKAEQALGYLFTDKSYLRIALTHASCSGQTENYERLEFLGDRVLGLVLTEHLVGRFPDADQGELTKRYHYLSNEGALAAICQRLNLHQHILHAPSQAGVTDRPSVQADIIESVLAAIYLDSGLDTAREFILANWHITDDVPTELDSNPKSELQEWAAARKLSHPVYLSVGQTGSAHEPVFEIAVEIAGIGRTSGSGRSRKQAEREAARRFLLRYVYIEKGQPAS